VQENSLRLSFRSGLYSNMRQRKSELESFVNEMTDLLIHIREHANLRGKVLQLDRQCQLCRVYFADKLSLSSGVAVCHSLFKAQQDG
jgi:hypothetical protein